MKHTTNQGSSSGLTSLGLSRGWLRVAGRGGRRRALHNPFMLEKLISRRTGLEIDLESALEEVFSFR